MELGWGSLIVLCLAGAMAWFWQDSLAARESANGAAMDACTRLGLQFLDGTVAFARLGLTREGGRLKLRRTYVFDYTANSIERRQGFVLLTGSRVESVGYARDERAPSPQTPTGAEDAKVLDLQTWRERQPGGRDAPAAPPLQEREDHPP